MLINVKMTKNCWHFNIYEDKFRAQPSWVRFFITVTSGPGQSTKPQDTMGVIAMWHTMSRGFVLCPGPEVIKLFSYSTQLSTKFILLINVKMPLIVGILTFISMINTSERLKASNLFICWYFSSYEQLKISVQVHYFSAIFTRAAICSFVSIWGIPRETLRVIYS